MCPLEGAVTCDVTRLTGVKRDLSLSLKLGQPSPLFIWASLPRPIRFEDCSPLPKTRQLLASPSLLLFLSSLGAWPNGLQHRSRDLEMNAALSPLDAAPWVTGDGIWNVLPSPTSRPGMPQNFHLHTALQGPAKDTSARTRHRRPARAEWGNTTRYANMEIRTSRKGSVSGKMGAKSSHNTIVGSEGMHLRGTRQQWPADIVMVFLLFERFWVFPRHATFRNGKCISRSTTRPGMTLNSTITNAEGEP